MTKLNRAFLFVLVLSVFPSAAAAQDKVKLELRLKKGQTFVQTMDTTQKIKQSIQGFDQVIDQAIGFTVSNSVLDVDSDGIATVEMKYDAVRWTQSSPLGKESYDSAKDKEATGTAKAFAGMLGSKLTVKMDRAGKVKELKGVDELMKKVTASADLPAGPQADMIKEQMKNQFSDTAMKQGIENTSAIYPDGPVAVGDSWKKKVEVDMGMQMIIETTYTLKERKDGKAIIDASSKVTPPEKLKGIAIGGAKMVMSLSGTQTAKMQLEEQSGLPVNVGTDQDLSGTMTVMDENGNELVKIPMSMTNKAKFDSTSPK